jgi:lipid A disaccharide synthetase
LFKDLLELRPDAFVSLGNEFFTKRLFIRLTNLYDSHELMKPPSIYVNNMLIDQRNEYRQFQDHILYSLPIEPVNWRYFKFPSTFVGVEGIAKAYRFLYQTSQKYQGFAKENSILISHQYHKDIMEELIEKEKVKFREKNGISESATVFYLAPGKILFRNQ